MEKQRKKGLFLTEIFSDANDVQHIHVLGLYQESGSKWTPHVAAPTFGLPHVATLQLCVPKVARTGTHTHVRSMFACYTSCFYVVVDVGNHDNDNDDDDDDDVLTS